MAFYGSLGDIDVGAISKSISDTAVDIFVYDTRKDSDGGAWRKRTQHTSWYNETLNTATRGARKDFPAVAVIVATTTSVTIYDGDDPDMPMWMVFQSSGYGMGGVYIFNAQSVVNSSIYALNGILVGGQYQATDTYGSPIINFINEKVVRMDPNSTEGGLWLGNIADRNSSKGYVSQASSGQGYLIVDSRINDVAMTVLPNAPIDPSTGLPVPTIAVATAGGASVIKDDGTVANIGGIITTKIDINQKLIFTASTANGGYYGFTVDGVSSINAFFRTVGNLRILSNVNTNTNNNLVVPNSSNLYSGQTVGLSLVYKNGLSNDNYDGMVSYITSSYNTGWMHGDIKGAWLSDTSTASVTGIELNQYGDFSSTTGWGSRTAAWTISGGVASVSSGAGFQLLGVTSGTLTNGRKYAITVNVTSFTAGRLELSQANSSNIQFNLSSTGLKSLIFTYTGTSGQTLGIYGYGDASYAFTIDNLYVRELSEADRSVNNTGLAVYGTITKTPVETGANLVGYSGFSSSNYLSQPYNSNLNFGTNSFSTMIWCKSPAGAGTYVLYSWRGTSGTLPFWQTYFGDNLTVFDIQDSSSNNGGFSINRSLKDNVWHLLTVVQRNPSSREFYIDGILVGTNTTTIGSLTSTAHELRVGTHFDGLYAYNGSLALFRVSATAPSPEQILKMYNDEKALFQPNSQCTLYGSSDAVTALAYDDTTKLLSVGTSSGRSDFQGLERINNTTTAVTTAISASNGLIAEQ